jgi:hypothetical protein
VLCLEQQGAIGQRSSVEGLDAEALSRAGIEMRPTIAVIQSKPEGKTLAVLQAENAKLALSALG